MSDSDIRHKLANIFDSSDMLCQCEEDVECTWCVATNDICDLFDEVLEAPTRGKEAEELRAGIERIIEHQEDFAYEASSANEVSNMYTLVLQNLLDEVDARDSLAHLESNDALECEDCGTAEGVKHTVCNRNAGGGSGRNRFPSS